MSPGHLHPIIGRDDAGIGFAHSLCPETGREIALTHAPITKPEYRCGRALHLRADATCRCRDRSQRASRSRAAEGTCRQSVRVPTGKYYRRSVWHIHCNRDVAELLLDELAECLHWADDRLFRQLIALTISAISVELDHTGVPKDVLIQSQRPRR